VSSCEKQSGARVSVTASLFVHTSNCSDRRFATRGMQQTSRNKEVQGIREMFGGVKEDQL